jgi:hypothetical protein
MMEPATVNFSSVENWNGVREIKKNGTLKTKNGTFENAGIACL